MSVAILAQLRLHVRMITCPHISRKRRYGTSAGPRHPRRFQSSKLLAKGTLLQGGRAQHAGALGRWPGSGFLSGGGLRRVDVRCKTTWLGTVGLLTANLRGHALACHKQLQRESAPPAPFGAEMQLRIVRKRRLHLFLFTSEPREADSVDISGDHPPPDADAPPARFSAGQVCMPMIPDPTLMERRRQRHHPPPRCRMGKRSGYRAVWISS